MPGVQEGDSSLKEAQLNAELSQLAAQRMVEEITQLEYMDGVHALLVNAGLMTKYDKPSEKNTPYFLDTLRNIFADLNLSGPNTAPKIAKPSF